MKFLKTSFIILFSCFLIQVNAQSIELDKMLGEENAMVIADYSSESLKPIFDEHIDKQAYVLADGWSGISADERRIP